MSDINDYSFQDAILNSVTLIEFNTVLVLNTTNMLKRVQRFNRWYHDEPNVHHDVANSH